jgi:hypothetical protein
MASTAPQPPPLYAPIDLAFHRSHTAHSLDGLDGGEDHADCAATCVSRSQPERRRGWLGRVEGGRRAGTRGWSGQRTHHDHADVVFAALLVLAARHLLNFAAATFAEVSEHIPVGKRVDTGVSINAGAGDGTGRGGGGGRGQKGGAHLEWMKSSSASLSPPGLGLSAGFRSFSISALTAVFPLRMFSTRWGSHASSLTESILE